MTRYQMVIQREDDGGLVCVNRPAGLSEVEAYAAASVYLQKLLKDGFAVIPFPCVPVWDAQRRDVKLTVYLSEDNAPAWDN